MPSLSFQEFLDKRVGRKALNNTAYTRLTDELGERRLSALLRLERRAFGELIAESLSQVSPATVTATIELLNRTLDSFGLRGSTPTLEDLLYEIPQTITSNDREALIKLILRDNQARNAHTRTNGQWLVVQDRDDEYLLRVPETLELVGRLQNHRTMAPETRWRGFWLVNLAVFLPVVHPARYAYPFSGEEFDGEDPRYDVNWAELDPQRYEALMWALETNHSHMRGQAESVVVRGIFSTKLPDFLQRVLEDYRHRVRIPGDPAATERRFYTGPRRNRSKGPVPFPGGNMPDPWPKDEASWKAWFEDRSKGYCNYSGLGNSIGTFGEPTVYTLFVDTPESSGCVYYLVILQTVTINSQAAHADLYLAPGATYTYNGKYGRGGQARRFSSWTALGEEMKRLKRNSHW